MYVCIYLLLLFTGKWLNVTVISVRQREAPQMASFRNLPINILCLQKSVIGVCDLGLVQVRDVYADSGMLERINTALTGNALLTQFVTSGHP